MEQGRRRQTHYLACWQLLLVAGQPVCGALHAGHCGAPLAAVLSKGLACHAASKLCILRTSGVGVVSRALRCACTADRLPQPLKLQATP